jgi:hypothetical protein
MRNLFVCFLFALTLVFNQSCKSKLKHVNCFKEVYNFQLSDSTNSVEIINNNNNSVDFTFELNNSFPVSLEKVNKEILEESIANKISPIQSAWLYVMKTTYHSPPITSNNWLHEPSLFLNSVGGGFCDDLSSVLVALWKLMGYEARVIVLEGHVVAEVKDSDGWHMYDADLMVYYTDSNGRVLSVEELENNPKIVATSSLGIDSNLNPFLRSPNYLTKI